MKKMLFVLMVLATSVFAQTLPTYTVSVGNSFNTMSSAWFVSGVAQFLVNLPSDTSRGMFVVTTLDVTRKVGSARFGLGYNLFKAGKVTVSESGDAGLAAIHGGFSGAFSLASSASYALPHNMSLAGTMRELAVDGYTTKPVYEISIGKSF